MNFFRPNAEDARAIVYSLAILAFCRLALELFPRNKTPKK
jgi:hypothetical protein